MKHGKLDSASSNAGKLLQATLSSSHCSRGVDASNCKAKSHKACLQIMSCFEECCMQRLVGLYSKLRQRRTLAKYVILAAVALGVCCSLALIKACSRICCDFGSQSEHALPNTMLGEGFQRSIRNLAAASSEDFQERHRWNWMWMWGTPLQDQVSASMGQVKLILHGMMAGASTTCCEISDDRGFPGCLVFWRKVLGMGTCL